MHKFPVGLCLLCAVIFITGMVIAFASESSAYGSQGSYGTNTRKGGDYLIWGYGTHHRSRSGRLGSVGNRTYRGGGVRGGK